MIKEKNKLSIILIILLFLTVISVIWICFILGEIEHNSVSKDSVDVFYKEEDKKNNVINDGEVIVLEKKDENDIIQSVIKDENKSNSVSKGSLSIKNKVYEEKTSNSNNVINDKKEDNNFINKNIINNEIKEEIQNPEEPSDIQHTKDPENTSKPQEPSKPNTPEQPEKPIDPNKPEVPDKPEKPDEPDPPKPPEIDRTGTYWAEDKDIVWENQCKLGIFKNPRYNMRNIVAPGSTNSYVFYVCNKMGFDLNYIINFSEENDINVNMMYKLRREDEYIAGDEDTWVYYDSLHIDYEIANEGKDKYILEWKWVDSDNDTEIGINHAGEVYKLNIDILATQISGFDDEENLPDNDNSNNESGNLDENKM